MTTTPSDFDRVARAWLAEGPTELSDRVLQAALDEAHLSRRRRALRLPWRSFMSVPGRAVAIALAAVAVLVAGLLLVGGGGGPVASPEASATAAPRNAAPTTAAPTGARSTPGASPAGLLAPQGYTGPGTIEFTRHDPSGADVLWIIDASGANPTKLVQGGCCGLFSLDGGQLALAAPGVAGAGLSRDPSLLGIEVLDRPGARVAFVVPTNCGACEVLGLNYEPDAWSPNGRYIALSMWSDSDPGKAGMGIADRDFSIPWDWAQTRATGPHEDIPIAFSPDSTQLLFMRATRNDGPTVSGPLFIVQVSDLSVREITPAGVTVSANGLIQGPASWSPDGQEIAFAGRDTATGTTAIYLVQSTPGSKENTLVTEAPGATSARFSPDGSVIAFDRQSAALFHDLYLIRRDGTGLTNLSPEFDPGICCAQWSPDGAAMVVAGTTSDDSHNDLFVVAADGSGIWQVTDEPNAYTGFLWGRTFR